MQNIENKKLFSSSEPVLTDSYPDRIIETGQLSTKQTLSGTMLMFFTNYAPRDVDNHPQSITIKAKNMVISTVIMTKSLTCVISVFPLILLQLQYQAKGRNHTCPISTKSF